MRSGLAEIVAVMDRSGSMDAMRSEAIGGYNAFLEEQKKAPGEAQWTLVLFDHEYLLQIDGQNIEDVPELNNETYVPRGTTALLDAVGRTIDDVGKRLADMPEDQRPEKVILAVMTDGMENASKDYTQGRVKEMIRHQEEKYGWKVIFLATDLGAVEYAVSAMGVRSIDAQHHTSYSEMAADASARTAAYRKE